MALKAGSDWLVKLRISFAVYLWETREKLASRFASVSSKLIFCGIYYLTVLVNTKTTIHLCVSDWRWIVVKYLVMHLLKSTNLPWSDLSASINKDIYAFYFLNKLDGVTISCILSLFAQKINNKYRVLWKTKH